MIEQKIKTYRDKVQALKELEQEIVETLPEKLWDTYNNLKAELESDKSVIQKEIKDTGTSVEVDGMVFKVSNRERLSIPDSFMYTAADLGHVSKLIDLGVITGIKVNEDMLERLPPDLSAIYSNLVEKSSYRAVTWPKKADQ